MRWVDSQCLLQLHKQPSISISKGLCRVKVSVERGRAKINISNRPKKKKELNLLMPDILINQVLWDNIIRLGLQRKEHGAMSITMSKTIGMQTQMIIMLKQLDMDNLIKCSSNSEEFRDIISNQGQLQDRIQVTPIQPIQLTKPRKVPKLLQKTK